MRHVDPDSRPDSTVNGGAHAGPYDIVSDVDPDALPVRDDPGHVHSGADWIAHAARTLEHRDDRAGFAELRARNRARNGDDAAEDRYRPGR